MLHPKRHCGSGRVEAYGDQVVSGVLAQIHLIVGPVTPQTPLVAISLVPECIIGIDTLSNWPNPHIGSLTYGVSSINSEKGQMEYIIAASIWENSKIKRHTTLLKRLQR